MNVIQNQTIHNNSQELNSPRFPCPCRALQKGKMSLEQFEKIVSHYRDIEVFSPGSPDKWEKFAETAHAIGNYLANDFFNSLIIEGDSESKTLLIQNIIANKGTFEEGNKSYKLILFLNKERAITGAALLHSKIHKNNAPLKIDALKVHNNFQRQYIATIMLACIVKVAQEVDRAEVGLLTNDEGIPPYLRFGFAPLYIKPSKWKKKSQDARLELALENSALLLRLDRQETKVAMNEQLYRALIDNPYSLVGKEKS